MGNNTKDDNLTLGKLLLGIGAFIVLIWLVKFLLSTLLNIAESILVLGFYVVVIYIIMAISLSIYCHFSTHKKPRIVKLALGFHHSLALTIKYSYRFICKLFRKTDS